jgi:hypothetical protein
MGSIEAQGVCSKDKGHRRKQLQSLLWVIAALVAGQAATGFSVLALEYSQLPE